MASSDSGAAATPRQQRRPLPPIDDDSSSSSSSITAHREEQRRLLAAGAGAEGELAGETGAGLNVLFGFVDLTFGLLFGMFQRMLYGLAKKKHFALTPCLEYL